jgi:hypothetical protein
VDLPQISRPELDHKANLDLYNFLKERLSLHDDCSWFEVVVDFGGRPFVRERFRIDEKDHCEIREL